MSQKNQATDLFSKCVSAIDDRINAYRGLDEFPEAKAIYREKYVSFARMMVQGSTHYDELILTDLCRIINGDL